MALNQCSFKIFDIRSSLGEKCVFVWEQIIENHLWLYGHNQHLNQLYFGLLLKRSVKKRCMLIIKMEREVVTGHLLKSTSFYIYTRVK